MHNVVNKLICIDSGCRLLIEVMKRIGEESEKRNFAFGADDFMPLLIYTMLKTNPLNIWSNIE